MTADTGLLPASAMMEALWWVHHRSKNKSVYNLTWRMTCDRAVDLGALAVAWQAVVDRHEALRSSLHHRDGRIFLAIADRVGTAPQRVVVEDPGTAPVPSLLRAIAEEIHDRPLDLATAPAARLTAVTVGDQHELVLTIHHSLVDGWGIQVLMADFSAAYAAALAGVVPSFESEPVSLRDYVLEAHAARTDGRWDASLRHWRETLDGAVTTTVVADRHRYTGTGYKGEILRYALSPEAVDGIAALAKQFFATPFAIILAALQTVLARGGGGPEVCSGVVTANRMTQQEQAMVGYVANVVVARTTIEDDDTFGTVVERTRDTMWGMLAHQAVPFALVFGALTESAQARLRDNIPVLMTYYGPIGSDLRLGDVNMKLLRSPNRAARTDIGMGVYDAEDGFVFECEYNTGRYEQRTAMGLLHDIDAVLAACGADPKRRVSTVDVQTKAGPAYVEHELTEDDLGTADVPASAALERVNRVWEEVLGAPPAGPDEDFFAGGGRSLKVVQLAAALEAETGAPLDMVGWLTEPTPRRAAEQLAGDLEQGEAAGTLVTLREGGGRHVHLLPGAGGSPQDYRDLVAALPGDWRVTLSQERSPLATVPEMAGRFRADLDAAGRPDLLVGWSLGGQVAFEMAAGYGAGAPAVAVLDATPPIGYEVGAAGEEVVYATFAGAMAAGLGTTVDGLPARTSGGDPELAMRVLAARLTVAAGQPVPPAMLVERWATFRRHTSAVFGYVAGRKVGAPALVVAADLADYQLEQWAERFTARPHLMRVDADHYGLLRPPAVDEIARAITRLQIATPAA